MRIGLFALQPSPGADALERLRAFLRGAADDGFHSAWLPTLMDLDPLTALTAVGGQVPGIELCTSVVPTYPRHPAALAQQALTADLALGGRLTLGIGLSHRFIVEDMYGYSFERPARHLREYLQILLPLLRGERAEYEGETVRAALSLSLAVVRPMPVLVAAMGPRMLELAGTLTDGTVLWMTGPKTVAEHIMPTITGAASAAGRPAPRVVCALPVCVTDDVEAARARAAEDFRLYGGLPSYRAMLDREGAAGPEDVAIIGDEETVAARLGDLEKAGVTDFAASDYMGAEDGGRTRALLRTLL